MLKDFMSVSLSKRRTSRYKQGFESGSGSAKSCVLASCNLETDGLQVRLGEPGDEELGLAIYKELDFTELI
jgi:hypothetical protein